MKAWKVTGVRALALEDLGAQPVPDDGVKLKMIKSAIGIPEAQVYKGLKGRPPVILGREGVGMVTETGRNVTRFKRGDRVYVGQAAYCGECPACRTGRTKECTAKRQRGVDADGTLCDFLVISQRDIHLLPQKITDNECVFIERAAAGIHMLDTLAIEKGEYIAIMGAGITGIMLAQLALYYQAVPILVDVRRDRLDIAEKLGIYYTVDAVSADPLKKIFATTCGKGAETLAYTMPSSLPLNRAFESLMPGGRAVIGGFADDAASMNIVPLLDQRVKIGFVPSGDELVPAAINAFASGAVEAEPLITRHVPFTAVGEVLEDIADDSSILVEIE